MIARILSIAVLTLSVVPTHAASDNDPLATNLQQVVESWAAAYDREDLAGVLSFVHSKSPEYSNTKKEMEEQFENQNLRVEIVRFRYMGHDDEFAVARVSLKTFSASEDPAFQDNVVDTIGVFHQEGGVWKYWSDHILGIEIVE